MVGMSILPFPICKLFQIHCSKTKLHPVCDLSQASVSGITHCVFLLGIRKDTFNGFFPCLIHPLVDRSVPSIISHFLVFLPDMPGNCFNAVFVIGTKVSCWAITADLWIAFIFPVTFPIGSAVVQNLVLRTDDTVEMLVINILPPFVPALHCLGTLIGCG